MKFISFKKKYSSFHLSKVKFLNLLSYNIKNKYNKTKLIFKKNYLVNMFTLQQHKMKNLKYKNIIGFLIKNSYKLNSTKIHLLQIKKYNNIYFSFYKEAPNIFIY